MDLLRRELRGILATVRSSLADFIITVFPYYLLTAARDATAVVALDMFYKVTRFAVLSYLIGAETVLPHPTRAARDEDAAGPTRATMKGLAIGLLPMVCGMLAIALFGGKIFGVILNHDGIVSPLMRIAICVMLAFTLIQTTCQIVLIGTGRFEELARRAGMTLAGMVLISTLMVLSQWSSDAFIVAYVVVYGAGSLLYAECLYSLVRSLRSRSACAARQKCRSRNGQDPGKDECGNRCAKCEPQGCCKIASTQSSFRSRHGAMISDVQRVEWSGVRVE